MRRPRVLPRIGRTRLILFLSILGPGLITANADNDAGGIATYSVAGARYGYGMLWMLLLITLSLAITQEMGARMGVVTGQGMAASGYILSELVEGRKIELDPLFASVYPERCAGCKVCMTICPYRAIHFDAENNVSAVNGVLCHGCGTCVAACPMGAIKANHFTSEMILAEIEGALK